MSIKKSPGLSAPQLVQAIAQRAEADAQQFGGLVLVAVGDFQGFQEVGALDFLDDGVEGHPARDLVDVEAPVPDPFDPAALVDREGQAVGQQDVGGGQRHAALQQVFQFADVARKIVLVEHVDGIRGNLGDLLAHLAAVFVQKMLGQGPQIALALAQRRHLDFDHVQAVEEILPEIAGDHLFFELLVGGGHDPDVDRHVFAAAHRLEGPLLNRPQQLDLDRQAEFTDLVQKNRALVGHLEEPFLVVGGASERPLLVSEKLAFHQRFGNAAAVDDHKGIVAAAAFLVHGAGHQLLAGAALAGDQNVGAGGCHLADHLVDVEHGRAVADNQAKMQVLLQFVVQDLFFVFDRLQIESLGDGLFQLVVVERFGHVIVGAPVHGLHGRLGGGISRDHDDGRFRAFLLAGLQHIQAGHVAELDIAKQQVILVLGEHVDGRAAIVGQRHAVALARQQKFEQLAHAQLIVDNQDILLNGIRHGLKKTFGEIEWIKELKSDGS